MTDAPAPPARRGRALLLLVPVALVLAFVVATEAAARGRVLHVINATPSPARVSIDGGPARDLPPGERHVLPLPEGDHVAEVERDGAKTTVPMTLRTPWLTRLGTLPAWVLNIEGAAPLVVETAVYAEGVAEARPPRVLFGEPFVALEEVHLLFDRFPEEVEASTFALTRLDLLPGDPATVLARLPRSLPSARRMDWAELHLRLSPADERLLNGYLEQVESEEDRARCTAFLEAGLDRRPVAVAWHRAHQDLLRARGREEELAARYARYLEATPQDAALLYLAGRLEVDAAAALARYEAALAADAAQAFAWHGKAFVAFARGEHDVALAAATKACELRPRDAEMAAFRDDVRLAMGRYDELQAELEAVLLKDPFADVAQRRLLEVLAAKGDLTGAVARHEAFTSAVRKHKELPEKVAAQKAGVSALSLADLEGDLDRLLAVAREQPVSTRRLSHELAAHLGSGRVADAAALVVDGSPLRGPRYALLVSLGWSRAGDAAQARAWRAKAAEWLVGSRRERRVAELLTSDRAPTPAELDALALPAVEAATVYAALADAWPGEPWLKVRAERATHGRYFPAWFLRGRR